MNRAEVIKLLDNIEEFPTIPIVAMKVNELVENPNSSANDLNQIISQDVSLATKVLKVVNSAYYGFRQRITSIKQAVVILGFNVVKQLAFSASILDSFKQSENSTFNRDDFWMHSVGVATAARLLAIKFKFNKKEVEELFTCGLLHDLGKMVEESFLQEQFQTILENTKANNSYIWEEENKVLGINHTGIGKWLAKKWSFHNHLRDSIAMHHSLELAKNSIPPEQLKIISIVSLSDIIVKVLKFGTGGDNKVPPIDAVIKTSLKVPQSTIQELVDELKKEKEKITAFVKSIT